MKVRDIANPSQIELSPFPEKIGDSKIKSKFTYLFSRVKILYKKFSFRSNRENVAARYSVLDLGGICQDQEAHVYPLVCSISPSAVVQSGQTPSLKLNHKMNHEDSTLTGSTKAVCRGHHGRKQEFYNTTITLQWCGCRQGIYINYVTKVCLISVNTH